MRNYKIFSNLFGVGFTDNLEGTLELSRFNYFFEDPYTYYVFNAISESILSMRKENNVTLSEYILSTSSSFVDKAKMRVRNSSDDDDNLNFKASRVREISARTLDINFLITDFCNLACAGCFNASSKLITYSDEFGCVTRRVIRHEVESARALFHENSINRISVSFSGGEPLLFVDRIAYVLDECNRMLSKCTVDYIVLTNGTLLTKGIVMNLSARGACRYYVSVDSTRCDFLGMSRNDYINSLIDKMSMVYRITGLRPIIRINVSDAVEQKLFAEEIINLVCRLSASDFMTLSFSRWHNIDNMFDYYTILPETINELYVNAINKKITCLWKWRDNIDKYMSCRKDSKNGTTIHPSGKKTLCPYENSAHMPLNPALRENCSKCCFLPICFGGCYFKRSYHSTECDYKMISTAIETHVFAKQSLYSLNTDFRSDYNCHKK